MRWSRALLNTLRDDPQEAEINSHKLMVRAGLVRKVAGGLYTFLPLGLRALHKVTRIIREEMDRAGAQEILMPALQPAELWERSGRLAAMGPGMFRLKDRAERLMTLGPTHEEVVTSLLAGEVSSYRQLPCTVYQVQTKFRDEIRPRFGLMRAKEFIMKDAYSFDTSMEAADRSYQAMYDAYTRIFQRCGLRVKPVEADTGDIGGSWSHEFMVLADSGEDGIVDCAACGYAANQERAERMGKPAAEAACPPLSEVPTPGVRTIEDLTAFFDCAPDRFIKTLIYLADGKPVAALVPGDRDVNEHKLKRLLNASKIELADEETIFRVTGAPVGFAGPAGLSIPVYADQSLEGAEDRVTGANRADTHYRQVSLARDARVTAYGDLTVVGSGDLCPRCGKPLQLRRGIEVGHVFKLGTKYSESFDAVYLNEKGQSEQMVMGCYGIGVTRTLQAVIEQSHDADGIIWPVSVAPFAVSLLLLDPRDERVYDVVAQLEAELEACGIDVFVDDREERPGVKFKDADLIGCPVRVVAGAKGLAKGGVEIKLRTGKESEIVPVEQAAAAIADRVKALTSALSAKADEPAACEAGNG
ncbi:MAG TPA: proline--tRNA ligase [Kiritimatiellia bacterium]|jgi:prolyl-tRNA synthetase|nr:proline--tRNA ligase [Kiritimatiellia bacterium]